MIEAAIGRLLVASLHQAIADLRPTRLEFYEAWLNPAGLRAGRIGLAPLAAVLSFLRQEGEPYRLVAARAGEYTAEWTVADLSAFKRAVIRAAPPSLRARLVMRVARSVVRSTCRSSRASVRWRKGLGAVHIRLDFLRRARSRRRAVVRILCVGDPSPDVALRARCRGEYSAVSWDRGRSLSDGGTRTTSRRVRVNQGCQTWQEHVKPC